MQKNAIFSKTKQFRAMVCINDIIIGNRTFAFKEPIIGPLKFKMAEIRHLGSWRQNAKTQFSQKLSNLELRCLLTTYRLCVFGGRRCGRGRRTRTRTRTLCIRRTLCRHVTIGTPMVIFAVLTVFWLLLTVFDDWVHCWYCDLRPSI